MHQVLVSSPKKIEAEIAAARNNSLMKAVGLNGSGELQKAADKITLMSPEVFEVKPKIKEEPRDIEENENLLTTPTRFVTIPPKIQPNF